MKSWSPLKKTVIAAAVAAAVHFPAHAQSLKDAVEMTIKTNPDILIESNQRLANDEAVKVARGGFFPKVDLLGGVGREHSDNSVTKAAGYNDGRTLTRKEAQVTLTQMLFDGFGVSSEVDRNKARVESAAYKTLGTAEDIALRAVEAYLNTLRNRELVAITKTNLDAHLKVQDQIRIRSGGGVGRKSDQEQIDARVGLAKANLVSTEAALRDAETTFLRIVGAKPASLARPSAPDSKLVPRTADETVNAAIDNHPILKSAGADVKATEAQREAAKSFMWPRLDLEMGAGNNRNLDGVKGENDERYAMLRARWNVFKGGSDVARIEETTHLMREATEVQNRTRRQVEESTRLSYNALMSATERLPALKEHADMSAATRDSYARQFNLGQRTLLDLLDSENETFTANTNYINGSYLELFARFRLLKDMGQLLSFLGVAAPEEAKLGN
ncbi:TolC family outer membrane protein [Azospira restricta]|uniref:TolC family outer membrane protein n=1 Tax=Azospira restricta TaxID=404405 RepID=A0A974PWS6_9RHOO|nr:TolC family outer membrane protein [Azospira restricta]QRJ62907.1 TolC family outer membrane protein [Azospira restricta]